MEDKELDDIIEEIKGMMLRGTPQDPVEAAKEQQRMDEIEAILHTKFAKTAPAIKWRSNRSKGAQ